MINDATGSPAVTQDRKRLAASAASSDKPELPVTQDFVKKTVDAGMEETSRHFKEFVQRYTTDLANTTQNSVLQSQQVVQNIMQEHNTRIATLEAAFCATAAIKCQV